MRLIRAVAFRSLAMLGALAAPALPVAAGTAMPRPLVILWELSAESGGDSAWPQGLRFALFDDGQLIGTINAGARFGAGDFVATRMAPAQARGFAAQLLAKARALPMRGDGTSYLRVWDAAGEQFVSTSAGALTHCGAPSASTGTPDRSLGFKPDFFTLCDGLIDYLRARGSPWRPRQLWVLLRRTEAAPETRQRIVAATPVAFADSADRRDDGDAAVAERIACLPLTAALEPDAVMTQSFTFLDGKPPLAAAPRGRPVRTDRPGTWQIVTAQYALPADLPLTDSGAVAHGCALRP